MAEKSNKLTVGLVKADFADFAEIVKPGMASVVIPDVGNFYMEPSHPRPPSWITEFFGAVLGADLGLTGRALG